MSGKKLPLIIELHVQKSKFYNFQYQVKVSHPQIR